MGLEQIIFTLFGIVLIVYGVLNLMHKKSKFTIAKNIQDVLTELKLPDEVRIKYQKTQAIPYLAAGVLFTVTSLVFWGNPMILTISWSCALVIMVVGTVVANKLAFGKFLVTSSKKK